jgi:phenylalanine-4-hydroxylase
MSVKSNQNHPLKGSYFMITINSLKTITVSKDYSSYTEEQHIAWNKLLQRQLNIIDDKACTEFIKGLEFLKEKIQFIPKLDILSAQLEEIVGWTLEPVIGLIEGQEYYTYLANRKFPFALNIRDTSNFDFSPVPDIWHDVFGHLPLLICPLYSNYVESLARLWLVSNVRQRQQIDKLYWFTIESGICQENGKRRVYGASQLSSFDEIHYALSDQPTVYPFDFQAIFNTNTTIDYVQSQIFEISSFDYLEQLIDDLKFYIDQN